MIEIRDQEHGYEAEGRREAANRLHEQLSFIEVQKKNNRFFTVFLFVGPSLIDSIRKSVPEPSVSTNRLSLDLISLSTLDSLLIGSV